MNFNTNQFTDVVERCLALAVENKRWTKAIERAADGLRSGNIIVTELASGALVTTENGSYKVNGTCECPAYANGNQPCKHRAARRLCALYSESEIKERIETREIESDHRGHKNLVVRYDGWMI